MSPLARAWQYVAELLAASPGLKHAHTAKSLAGIEKLIEKAYLAGYEAGHEEGEFKGRHCVEPGDPGYWD